MMMKALLLFFLSGIASSTITASKCDICTNDSDQEVLETSEKVLPESTRHCHCGHCHHQKNDDKKNDEKKLSEKEIQKLAVGTLVNMTQGMCSIISDPHNPTNVANNVTTIVGSFINLVAHAMSGKKIEIEALFSDESFQELCKKVLVRKVEQIKSLREAPEV